MDTLIETIRTATAEGATDEAKKAGAQACRAILAALETAPGEPLAAVTPPPRPLAGLQPDQILDLVIAKLRNMVPAEKPQPAPARAELRIPLINLPK